MKSKLLNGLVLTCVLVGVSSFAWGQDYMLEPASAEMLKPLPKPLQDSLDPHGFRLVGTVNGVKTTVCEVWWRKVVYSRAGLRKSADVLYGELRPGSLLGVLYFPNQAEGEIFRRDFRDQKLEPGFYTLRYAQINQEKDLVEIPNHKDKNEDDDDNRVSSYRDFLVLSAVRSDTGVDELSFSELFRLGRQASGTKNPAILSLVQVNPAYKNFPAVVPDDSGDCTVQSKLTHRRASGGKRKELPVAVLLVTPHAPSGES